MKMQKFILILILAIPYSFNSYAQDMSDYSESNSTADVVEETEETAEKKLNFSGSVDAYFRTNLSAKNNPAVSYPVPGTSFANGNGFSLGMFNLISSYEGDKAGIVADLVFGPRGEEAVFGSGASSNIVNQLYAYWNATESLTFTIGNFNTFLGYEVISPLSNFNYSTSYMFSYGPFSHTGLKADIGLSEKMSLMLGVFNPTDMTETNFLNSLTLGAQLGFAGEASSVYLNLLYGDQDGTIDEDFVIDSLSSGSTFQVDLTAGFDVSESFYVGINSTYNSTSAGEVVKGTGIEESPGDPSDFYGFAAYLQYAASDAFSIGVRGEYFGEANFGAGAIGAYDEAGDASVLALTLSGNIKIGGLTLIPELRLDNASEETTFLDSNLANSSSLASFLLAAVYGF